MFTYKHCSIKAHILLLSDYSAQLFTVDMFFLFIRFTWVCFILYIKKFEKILLRSSHSRCSVRTGVLRNFTKFTGKHLCQSFFLIKLQTSSLQLYFKKRLWHRCFPVNFVKFLRAPFFLRTSSDDWFCLLCIFLSLIDFLETKYMLHRNWSFFGNNLFFPGKN